MSTLLKKMSPKTLGVNAKQARDSHYAPTAVGTDGQKDPRAGQAIPLFIVYGKAGDTKMFDSDYGVSTAIIGEFEAAVIQPGVPNCGKQFSSGKLFLPKGITEVIEGAVQSLGGSGAIEFGLKIYAQWHDSAIGYEYLAENLRQAKPTDSLAHLRGEMQEFAGTVDLGPPAIAAPEAPAPKQLEAPAPEPEATQAPVAVPEGTKPAQRKR